MDPKDENELNRLQRRINEQVRRLLAWARHVEQDHLDKGLDWNRDRINRTKDPE